MEGLPDIPGLDPATGIAMTGGTEVGYRKVPAQFYKDASSRLSVFAIAPAETPPAVFVTQAHAIKSAAGTIGAAEVSKEAAVLEARNMKEIDRLLGDVEKMATDTTTREMINAVSDKVPMGEWQAQEIFNELIRRAG